MERLKTRSNTMPVPGAICELDKIEMTRRNGGHYLLDHALTKNQKTIFAVSKKNRTQNPNFPRLNPRLRGIR